VFSNMSM